MTAANRESAAASWDRLGNRGQAFQEDKYGGKKDVLDWRERRLKRPSWLFISYTFKILLKLSLKKYVEFSECPGSLIFA